MRKEIIFIGLGKMGIALSANLVKKGYKVHGFDLDENVRSNAERMGINTLLTTKEALGAVSGQKIVWLMVPAKHVDSVLEEIYPELNENDIIIDGGNSFYLDTIRRAAKAREVDINYIDCGTSGGVGGARDGASLMIGADEHIFLKIEDLFSDLAIENGYARVGNVGSGHFVKMVHNGIEYGMMGAIAEGMSFIEENIADLNIDSKAVLKPYCHGSIIAGSLMNYLAEAYNKPGYLDGISGKVPQGETESEMEFIAEQKQTPILQAALQQRKATRIEPTRAGALISAMRNSFGGHNIEPK